MTGRAAESMRIPTAQKRFPCMQKFATQATSIENKHVGNRIPLVFKPRKSGVRSKHFPCSGHMDMDMDMDMYMDIDMDMARQRRAPSQRPIGRRSSLGRCAKMLSSSIGANPSGDR